MLEKYKKLKSKRRVTFHLCACSLIFLIFAVIAKELIISLILGFVFILCLIVYLLSYKGMGNIEQLLIDKCIKCDNSLIHKEETKYLLYGQNVIKDVFENDITSEKKKIEVKKYICNNCHLCFSIVEIYQLNNKGLFSLIKKEKHLLDDYVEKD